MRAVALSLLLVAACSQKPANEATTQVAPDRQAPVVALMDLTITQEGRPIARLHPDGRTQGTEPDSSGKPGRFVPGPTLRADGTISLTVGGFTARVDPDGAIYVVAPPSQESRERLFGRISGQVLTLAGSDDWAVRVDGDTLRFNGPGFPNKIEGEVDDRVRHTALVLAAAFYIDLAIKSR
jgi:hypothetical protein